MASKNFFCKWVVPATLLVVSSVLFSCQKDLTDDAPATGATADLTAKTNASVSGFVTDEHDAVVTGATVSFGGSTAVTDRYGYFEFQSKLVTTNAATVTVSKPGYFKGIKTFIANTGKEAFFRIRLIPKTLSGSIVATTGGTVQLTNGLTISLPANAVVTAGSNAAYTGTINVAAYWIDPSGNDLIRIMPGDLRGIDASNALKSLTTYGMAAVELTGSAGEQLQIKAGMKAILTMPLPTSHVATAPASIPLWYFDETIGLWKEEGVAVKTGATYVGEVSHFSFWNCDVPANYVQFNCTVTDAAGHAMVNAMVKISVVANPNNAAYGFTNSTGYVSGAVPGNASLLLQVFADHGCGAAIYTQTFSTSNTNLSLGTISIPNTSTVATISGTVTNCAGAAVAHGYVIMQKDNVYSRYPLSATGAFNFSTLLCSNTANIHLITEDSVASQQSLAVPFSIITGLNAVGNIQACGVTTSQFINYTINGASYGFTAPVDSLVHYAGQTGTTAMLSVVTGMSGNHSVQVAFNNNGIAASTTQPLSYFHTSDLTDSMSIVNPIMVNITEYGAIGGFVSGNFTGTFRGGAPANINYNVNCSFRVRRTF